MTWQWKKMKTRIRCIANAFGTDIIARKSKKLTRATRCRKRPHWQLLCILPFFLSLDSFTSPKCIYNIYTHLYYYFHSYKYTLCCRSLPCAWSRLGLQFVMKEQRRRMNRKRQKEKKKKITMYKFERLYPLTVPYAHVHIHIKFLMIIIIYICI